MDLRILLGQLKTIGFYDIVLPWVLFFAITYAILYKYGPFDNNTKKQTSGIIAFALAFFAVAYTPYGTTMATFLTNLFGQGSTILAAILLTTIIAGMLGIKLEPTGETDKEKEKNKRNIILGIIIIGAIIYYYSGPVRNIGLPAIASTDTLITLIVLAGMGYLVYWMLKPEKKEETQTQTTSPTPTPKN